MTGRRDRKEESIGEDLGMTSFEIEDRGEQYDSEESSQMIDKNQEGRR